MSIAPANTPKYALLARDVERRIRSGELEPGLVKGHGAIPAWFVVQHQPQHNQHERPHHKGSCDPMLQESPSQLL